MYVIDAHPDTPNDQRHEQPGYPPADPATVRARQVAERVHQAALAAVHAARADTETQIARADTKATALLGVFGAALAGALVLARTTTGLATALLAAAIVALTAAVAALLLVVAARPGRDHGPARWALFHAHPTALIEDLTLPARHDLTRQATRLTELARLAVTKYRAINTAVLLLLTGLLLLTLAAL